MADFPVQVQVNEQQISKLTKIYKSAYKEIVAEITGATNFGVANRKAILGQIESTLSELGTNVDEFIKNEIPQYYETGASQATAQLSHVGADVSISEGFNRVHKEAINALIDDTQQAFYESLSGVNRSARLLLGKAVREQVTQKIATGQIGGQALKEIKANIVGTLQEQGLDALTDRAGRRWTLDRYSEMLLRSKAVEARNTGMANRMVENGYDLVQVSSHGATDVCGDWEGKILSLTGQTKELNGKPVPTVADAEKEGLFHPNCKHAINVIVLELARRTNAYKESDF